MGLLDDTIRQFTQGQGASGTPSLAVVIQELLVGRQQAGGQPSSGQQQAEVPRSGAAAQGGGAGAGGLADLLAQLQAAGLDDIVKSWVGTGQNKPVQPEDLGEALGRRNVTQMADKAGCSQDDLLTQLARALPTIIDRLTQDGRVPTQTEVSQRLRGQ
jgi:uncharacterized protein YidB (DUF937 family)